MLVELDLGRDTVVGDLGELRQVLGRIGRVGLLHGGDQGHGGVVRIRRIDLDRAVLAGEAGHEVLGIGHVLRRHTGLGAVLAFGGTPGELGPFRRAHAVTGNVLGLDAELLHLLDHGAALRIHPAVHDDVGALGLDLGQDRLEVGRLVVGELVRDDGPARRLRGLLGLFGKARAVCGLVVDDGDLLGAERGDGFLADHASLLHVVGHDPERGLEPLQRVLGIGGRGRDLRNAGVAIELRGGNGRARIQVADHAGDLGIDQLLRHGRALLGIRLVVFRDQLEFDLLAVDDDVLGVGVIDRHAGTVLVILAQVRLRARGWPHVADLDCGPGHCRCSRGCRRFYFLRLLFTAAVSGHQRCGDKGQTERAVEFHEFPPGMGNDRNQDRKKGRNKRLLLSPLGLSIATFGCPGRYWAP